MGLDMPLHQGRARLVQHAGQDPAGQIRHRHLAHPVPDALHAFETDKSRAHHQHPAVRPQRLSQRPGVIQGHEGEAVLHPVQSLHRRHEGPGTGGHQQLVVGQGLSPVQRHLLLLRIDPHGGASQQGPAAVLLIKAVGAIFHPLLSGLSPQQIGDQRPGIGMVGLAGYHRDGAAFIQLADALDTAHRRGRVAYYHITHGGLLPFPPGSPGCLRVPAAGHRSSNTIARFGQPLTQAGSPSLFRTHSSHFCTAPSGEGMIAP